jgi:hypothetical protein
VKVHGGARQGRADQIAALFGQNAAFRQQQRLHIMLIFVGCLKRGRDQRAEEGGDGDSRQQQLFQPAPWRGQQHVGATGTRSCPDPFASHRRRTLPYDRDAKAQPLIFPVRNSILLWLPSRPLRLPA